MIKTVKLEGLASVKGGKRLPKGVNLITTPNSHPYIRVRDLNNRHTLELNVDFEYVDDETQKNIARYIVDRGDIVLSIVGTIGLVAIVGDSLHHANLTENCVKLTQLNGVNRDYLYYFLKSELGQAEIAKGTVGAVQAKLPIKNIQAIEVVLPGLEQQEKIASILAEIDYKIEANEKINDNLQQQIKSLVTAWLVDYIPFGGEMPSDWCAISLASIADFVSGYSYKGTELQPSTTAMATIKNFDRNGGFKLDGFKELIPSSKIKPCHYAEKFDVVVAHTDLTQKAEVIGNAEPIINLSGYEAIVFSMDLVKVVPKDNCVSKFMLAALLQHPRFKSHCLGYVNGTTVLHLSKKALPDYELDFPTDPAVLAPLDDALRVLYMQMATIVDENRKLQDLRDTLLPRLMRGEIDVSNIDI